MSEDGTAIMYIDRLVAILPLGTNVHSTFHTSTIQPVIRKTATLYRVNALHGSRAAQEGGQAWARLMMEYFNFGG